MRAPETTRLAAPVFLNGVVTDDGLPGGGLSTEWRVVNAPEGNGENVDFESPAEASTKVTFLKTGKYVLNLTASDGELSTTTEVAVTVREAQEVAAITQVGSFATGFENDSPLRVPSTDPAALVYHPPSGRLFIADSEINEIDAAFADAKGNIFQVSLSGDTLYDTWDVTVPTHDEPPNEEPTGIAYCPGDDHFYMSNDDRKVVYRYALVDNAFVVVDWIKVSPYQNDPEDLACDADTGRIYVLGGTDQNLLVYLYQEGFMLETTLDLSSAEDPADVPGDPEGIAFDSISGHLFVVSARDKTIFEYTSSGDFVGKYDIGGFSPRPLTPQGIAIGPSSQDSKARSFYITDGGLDNDRFPEERDGTIYEAAIERRAP